MLTVASRTGPASRPAAARIIGRLRAWPRRIPAPLAILLALAALQGVAWAVVTAPWQGPDEVSHFAYVQHLAETGHAPARDGGDGAQAKIENLALHHLNLLPIRLQPEGKPTWSALGRTEGLLAEQPRTAWTNGSGPSSTANYPPLYYAYEAIAYKLSPARSLLGRLFVMRLATVVLLVATVALAWLVASELLAARWARVVATGMVALQPKMGFEGGIVNPDMMLALWATACLLVCIRMVRAGPSLRRTVVASVLALLAVVTHPRGLFLPPFVGVALVVAFVVWRPRVRSILRTAVAGGAILLLGLVLAAAWTRTRSVSAAGAAAGGTFGSAAPTAGFNLREFVSNVWQFYLPRLTFMEPHRVAYGYRQFFIETYFGSFASFSVNYRPVVYDWLQAGAGAGLVVLYTAAVARWRTLRANWPVVVLVVTFFGGLMLLLHLVSYGSLRTTNDPVMTGRYLLPAIALYGTAIAWVTSSLPRRIGVPLAGGVLGLSALLAVGGIGLSLARFYA